MVESLVAAGTAVGVSGVFTMRLPQRKSLHASKQAQREQKPVVSRIRV